MPILLIAVGVNVFNVVANYVLIIVLNMVWVAWQSLVGPSLISCTGLDW